MSKGGSAVYESIKAYFQAHRQELLDDIQALIRIPSVTAPPEPDAPFGRACAQVLDEAVRLAESFGLSAHILEHKIAYADLNDLPAQLDILVHLDVVPPGDGWTVTQPFVPLSKDGRLYGRGTSDDKGPAVAALYAMRAVKELGIPMKYNTRLIFGSDEETGSRDIDCYYSHFSEAPCSFSPDGEYPVINLEKGGIYTSYSGTWEGESPLPCVVSVDGGTVGNAVPGKAQAVTMGLDWDTAVQIARKTEAQTGITFTLERQGEQILIQAQGQSAHASTPWEGRSAITGLLQLIAALPFAPCPGLTRLHNLLKLFPHGEFYGRGAGIYQSDEKSGFLTLTSNVIHYTQNSISGRVDCRTLLCATEENTLEVLRANMAQCGFLLPDNCSMLPPHYVPEDSPFIQTLLRCYEQVMEEPGCCLAIGGGTYAHFLKNGVAFGASKLGVDYCIHGPNEYLVEEEILKTAQLFTLAIAQLCGA